ncbi:non-ribosomal peptide synthetase [Clostridium estertheticum]|uniref:non-ribosomal peptide synthetase n=1 Tax=Clostridium estertheticum TaxID=238834 RepID=UPI001CF3D0D7|nr:non-ribosomal peptide synthetase [Clostridium estertheticum]MCB2354693.1 amino acid adenylation domain-containing protein [Clostridium estertheticum]WAG40938.1 amino acid adenylation domain-containing protein [Clostridium estertheticum]
MKMNKYLNLIDVIKTVKSLKDKGITFIRGLEDKKEVSYHDLYKTSLAILSNLQLRGLKNNDMLLFQISENEDFIYVFWACILGGIIPVPVDVANNQESSLKLFRIWNLLENPYMVTDQTTIGVLQGYAENNEFSNITEQIVNSTVFLNDILNISEPGKIYNSSPDDIAFITFSSGSTGEPKGILMTHNKIITNVTATIKGARISEEDSVLFWTPLTHAIGMVVCHLLSVFSGINMYNMSPKLFAQDPNLWIKKASEYRATFLSSPNYGLKHLLDNFMPEEDVNLDLTCVRLLLNGSEPISKDLCDAFLDRFDEYGLKRSVMFPFYGMSETGCIITVAPPGEGFTSVYIDYDNINIGQLIKEVSSDNVENCSVLVEVGFPVEECYIRICDGENRLLDENVVGYIQVKGGNVTGGYYGNEKATKELFVGDRWINTGDVGFIRTGSLIVTGRAKDIIFVNGQNFYPYDIERVAFGVGGIDIGNIAVCSVFNKKVQREEILAFVMFEDDLEKFMELQLNLKNYINKNMGLVVEEVIPVKDIPRTISTKIERYKLGQMYQEGNFDHVLKELNDIAARIHKISSIETQDEIEKELLKIWSKILKVENMGVNDSFFCLGGHSINLMQIMGEIYKKFGMDITFNDFIKSGTVAALALIIKENESKPVKVLYPQKSADDKKLHVPFPLTEIQSSYHIGRNNGFELGGVCTHFYIEIETKLEMERLNSSLQKVINRHPALRMIVLPNGEQQILEKVPQYIIKVTDLSNLSSDEQLSCIMKERDRMSHFVFKAEEWPLFEFKAFKLSDKLNYMFVGFDLLIADGASVLTIGGELVDYYKNPKFAPPELEFSFRDYVLAYKELKNSELYLSSKKYWHDKLEDFPQAPSLPLKKKPIDVIKPHFNRKSKYIGKNQWEKLKKFAMKNNLTPSTLVYTAYAQVLSYWSNQPRFAVNLTIFNRYPFHKDVEKIIGDFTSVMIVDVDLQSGKSFVEKARDVQRTMMQSLEHRHYDGVEFIRDIAKYNNYEANRAIMPVVFTSILFNGNRYGWNELGEIKVGITQTSQVYLDNQVIEMDEGVSVTWDYVEELFDTDIIDSMFCQYVNILESLAETEEGYELKPMERDLELLKKYNSTDEDIVPETLQNMFMVQAMCTPDNIAVTLCHKSITYRELDEMSNRIANYLGQHGVERGNMITVKAKRKIETIANIIGILKAGATYICVEPEYPEERIKYIMENSNCSMLMEPNLYYEMDLKRYSPTFAGENGTIDDIAYVIYTSGSTGKPKGVVITHREVSNTIIDINRKFSVNEKDRIIGLSSMCFDLSVYDIFGALSTGATLCMVNDQRDAANLIEMLKEQRITIWNSVPAIMDMCIEAMDDKFQQSDLRMVMLSGDYIPLALPEKIKNHFGSADVISLGGATEASIWSIYYPIKEVRDEWNSIPYGGPLANQKFYVLNYNLDVCPIDVQGELYIGGVGVAKEYLNDKEITEKSFLYHPVFGRIYRTGDYGVMHRDGYIEFLGRKDFQVKIRGYRIELGEIENSIIKHDTISNAVVVDCTDENDKKFLCAYMVAREQLSVAEMREYLEKQLPNYMIPSYFIYIDEIPLTQNGKVDKKALPDPKVDSNELVLPRNKLEEKLLKIWRKVIGTEKIGVKDGFFDLGGNSINAQRIINLIYKNFNVRLNIRKLYSNSSVENVARYIEDNPNMYCGEVTSVELQQSSVKFYWSPLAQWEITESGICIHNRVYDADVAGEVFPEFYFVVQKGVTQELLIEKFAKVDSGKLKGFIKDLIKNRVLISALQKPQEIFATQEKLFKNVFGDDILYDSNEYHKFKISQLNRGFSGARKDMELFLDKSVNYPTYITNRRSHRVFNENEEITFKAFSEMLAVIRQNRTDNKECYYYATAGGLYPIDTFIYMKENRVHNVAPGLYYYNPVRNSISMVNNKAVITDDAHFFRNKSIFRSSAFSIFMVYNPKANMPIYGCNGYNYAFIDCGIMVATLTQAAELSNIGLCSIGEMNFEMIEGYFNLDENQILIHTIEAGLKTEIAIENFEEIMPCDNEITAAREEILADIEEDIQIDIEDDYMGRIADVENINIPFPLNDIQHAYLVGRESNFELGNTSAHYYLEIETHMNYDKFNESVKKVIKRHPMLRVIILPIDGMQKILETVKEYNVGFKDISSLIPEEQELKILKQRDVMADQIFKPDLWPLFDFKMLKLSNTVNYLFMSFDLLISDGASVSIIIRDIMHYYNNSDTPLKDLEFSFRDYIIACDDLKLSETYARDKQYWMSKLADFPQSPELPLKQRLSSVTKPKFKQLKRRIEKQRWERIKLFARENKVTQSALLCTAFSEVMAYWSNQPRFILDLTIFNRYPFHKDVEDIVGDFTSLIILDVNFANKYSFIERVINVQEDISKGLEHKNYNGAQFIRDVSKYNNYGVKAVVPIVFTSMLFDYAGENSGDISRLGELKVGASQTPQVYLDCQISELEGGLYVSWDYIDQLFDEEVINNMFDQYMGMLEEIAYSCTVSELKCMEKDRLLIEEYNKTGECIDIAPIHELFIRQVAATPENIAVISNTGSLTYRQLDKMSNQVANYLKEQGIGSNCFVGVLGERCEGTIVNVIGILKAGAAYVPIDPEYPMDRKDYIRENSGFVLLLDDYSYSAYGMHRYSEEFEAEMDVLDDVAYVIYTSGSTGRPKGVVVKHRAVANTIVDVNKKFKVNGTDNIIGISSMAFDLSVYDIFGALSMGAKLVMAQDKTDINNLIETVNKYNITLWNSVPAIMDMVLENVDDSFINYSLRLVLLSGDWIPLKLPGKIRNHFVNAQVVSLGGATEASIWSIYYPIEKVMNKCKSIPYGMPLANQKFYVLNFERKLCPIGVEGELYIGGVGLASEYMNDMEKTRDSFIEHLEFGRLYETGDYGVMHREGYIEFLGRKDHQVKIRGYRIELGEIESRLMELEDIKNAVVIDNKDNYGKQYLCAYIVSGRDMEVQELRDYLALILPEYMIPAYFIRMEAIPLTPNGKVNKKVLPMPNIEATKTTKYEAPRNEIEEKLAQAMQEIIGIEKVGILDNFFELGGDSIKAIQISSRIQKYGLKMRMQDLFYHNTIAELSSYVKPLIKKADQCIVTGAVKLGAVQKWFFKQIKTDRHYWNQGFMLFRKDGFSEERIKKVMDKILEHHDALRMTYVLGDSIEQFNKGVHENMYCLKSFDFRSSKDYFQKIKEMSVSIQQNMNLSNGLLVNLGLFKTVEGDYLLMTVHHLVVDGVSWRILIEDFTVGYGQASLGVDISFQDKTASFKEWIGALYKYAESKALLAEISYWKQVECMQVDKLFIDGQVSQNRFADGDMISTSLSEKDTEDLTKGVNRAYNMEINEVLLSALGLALKECGGMERIAVNLEGHGREDIIQDIDISRTVGWFTSMYPVVIDMTRSEEFVYYIKQVKETLRQIPNKGVGYGVLRYLTSIESKKQLSFCIEPEISFNYLGQFNQEAQSNDIRIRPIVDQSGMGENTERNYLLDVVGYIYNNELTIRFIYNRHAYKRDNAIKLAECYKSKLLEIIEHCMGKEETEITPGDLEYKKLTIEELDDITDLINI